MAKVTQTLNSLRSILRTTTLKQSSVTFTGTVLNGLLGALFYIIIARKLGPASFGITMIAVTVLTLLADVADLGTDTGLVNFVSRYIKSEPQTAFRYLKLALKIKLLVWLILLVLGLASSRIVAVSVFGRPELVQPLRIVYFGVGGSLLFTLVIHTLQGMQRFWIWGLVQMASNAARLVIIFLLILSLALGAETTLIAYILPLYLGFLLGLLIIPKDFFKVKGETKVARSFFKYNVWVAAFTFLAAISSRLETFIAARLLPLDQVGIFSAAGQLTVVVPQIVVALGTVISPKMAAMDTFTGFLSYLKKTQLLVSGLVILGLLSVPIVSLLIPVIFGNQYLPAVPVFIVLFFGEMIFLFSVPVHSAIFYYYAKPKVFFWLSVINFIFTAIGSWIMIGRYGVMGAALVTCLGSAINFLVPLAWLRVTIAGKGKVKI